MSCNVWDKPQASYSYSSLEMRLAVNYYLVVANHSLLKYPQGESKT